MDIVAPSCSHSDCSNAVLSKGLCGKHYQVEWRKVNPDYTKKAAAKYKEKYPERVKASRKRYREAHPEAAAERNKKWRAANAETLAASKKKYAQDNAEKLRGYYREYRLTHKDKLGLHYRTRRDRLKATVSEEFTDGEVLEKYGMNCHICGLEIDLRANRAIGRAGWEKGLHIDHIVPISKGGADTLDNVRPSHGMCNLTKGNRA